MSVRPELHTAPYLDDPSSWLELFRELPKLVLFDSCQTGDQAGRYHIITGAPLQWLSLERGQLLSLSQHRHSTKPVQHAQEVWAALAHMAPTEIEAPLPFCGGLAGLLGYEFGRLCQLDAQPKGDFDFPDLAVGYYPWALVQDSHNRTSTLCLLPDCPAETRRQIRAAIEAATAPVVGNVSERLQLQADMDVDAYAVAFDTIQRYILDGDCYQINLTQRFSNTIPSRDSMDLYRALRVLQPGPMAGFFAVDEARSLLSLSPERLVSCRQGRALAQPIKGTSPRARDAQHDEALARALRASVKDKAENLMIVDLLRNDLGKVCRAGSVTVPALFALHSFENVHHLVSSVEGELAPDKTPLDLLAACFPGGSVTGAPKRRAMEIIDEVEPHSRSAYCGSLFYLSANGNLDANITIRSLVASPRGVACWGGGGITSGSQLRDEYQESITKVARLIATEEHGT